MSKVLILRGLPASGKTTYAKELIKDENWIRVNKDSIRKMLFDGKWNRKQEQLVNVIRDDIISNAITKKWNIVIDDTNIHPKHIINIKKVCETFSDIEIEYKLFNTSVEECIKRDSERENSVGIVAIRTLYKTYKNRIEEEDKWIK